MFLSYLKYGLFFALALVYSEVACADEPAGSFSVSVKKVLSSTTDSLLIFDASNGIRYAVWDPSHTTVKPGDKAMITNAEDEDSIPMICVGGERIVCGESTLSEVFNSAENITQSTITEIKKEKNGTARLHLKNTMVITIENQNENQFEKGDLVTISEPSPEYEEPSVCVIGEFYTFCTKEVAPSIEMQNPGFIIH